MKIPQVFTLIPEMHAICYYIILKYTNFPSILSILSNLQSVATYKYTI